MSRSRMMGVGGLLSLTLALGCQHTQRQTDECTTCSATAQNQPVAAGATPRRLALIPSPAPAGPMAPIAPMAPAAPLSLVPNAPSLVPVTPSPVAVRQAPSIPRTLPSVTSAPVNPEQSAPPASPWALPRPETLTTAPIVPPASNATPAPAPASGNANPGRDPGTGACRARHRQPRARRAQRQSITTARITRFCSACWITTLGEALGGCGMRTPAMRTASAAASRWKAWPVRWTVTLTANSFGSKAAWLTPTRATQAPLIGSRKCGRERLASSHRKTNRCSGDPEDDASSGSSERSRSYLLTTISRVIWPLRGKLLKVGDTGSRMKWQNSPPSLSWMEAPRGDDQRYHHHGMARPAG